MQWAILLRPEEDGGFTVTVPALQGAITYGDTYEEALARAREVIEMALYDFAEEELPAPVEPIPILTTVDVAMPTKRDALADLEMGREQRKAAQYTPVSFNDAVADHLISREQLQYAVRTNRLPVHHVRGGPSGYRPIDIKRYLAWRAAHPPRTPEPVRMPVGECVVELDPRD